MATDDASFEQLRARLQWERNSYVAAVDEADEGGEIQYDSVAGRYYTYTAEEQAHDRRVAAVGQAVQIVMDVATAKAATRGGGSGSLRVAARRAPRQVRTYVTYTKTNPVTGQVYSGRTSGFGTPTQILRRRDAGHHMTQQGFGPAQVDRASTNRDAIRGREQQLVDAYGGAQSQGGSSGNAINAVSPRNKKAARYKAAAEREFGDD